jgi:aspartate racemase
MPCNAAHAFLPEIRAATGLPFASIIEEALAELRRRLPDVGRVGLLTADGCRQARLYEGALEAAGLEPVTTDADEQDRLMKLVYAIKAGQRDAATVAGLRGLGEALVKAGAEAVIAGCTEVPLVLTDGELSRPLIDSTAVLAAATVAYGKRLRPLPARQVAT